MTLIDFIINLFKVFKKEEPKKDYVIPGAMNNSLVMMQTAQKLSDAELNELKKQIIDMGNRCITHYVIHTTTRGPTLAYDYNSGDDIFHALPLSWVRKNVKKYKTAIEFKVSYNFNKGNFGFKFLAVTDASELKSRHYSDHYGHYFAMQNETPQDILNNCAGWKSSAAEKTSVRRKTNDAECFKSAVTMMIEAIKADDIGKAKIAAHNMQTSKTISLLA